MSKMWIMDHNSATEARRVRERLQKANDVKPADYWQKKAGLYSQQINERDGRLHTAKVLAIDQEEVICELRECIKKQSGIINELTVEVQ